MLIGMRAAQAAHLTTRILEVRMFARFPMQRQRWLSNSACPHRAESGQQLRHMKREPAKCRLPPSPPSNSTGYYALGGLIFSTTHSIVSSMLQPSISPQHGVSTVTHSPGPSSNTAVQTSLMTFRHLSLSDLLHRSRCPPPLRPRADVAAGAARLATKAIPPNWSRELRRESVSTACFARSSKLRSLTRTSLACRRFSWGPRSQWRDRSWFRLCASTAGTSSSELCRDLCISVPSRSAERLH